MVYVDNDAVAGAHTTLLLERQEVTVGFVQADPRQPVQVAHHPLVRRPLNFREPVCVLMVAVLHFVRDEDRPGELVAAYRTRLAPGSLPAITHTTVPATTDDEVSRIVSAYQDTSLTLRPREPAEIETWSAAGRWSSRVWCNRRTGGRSVSSNRMNSMPCRTTGPGSRLVRSRRTSWGNKLAPQQVE